MVKPPLISVIMSVYNAEKYVSEAVESILSQTFSDFEFIIIEDCSTDSSLEIVEVYAKKDARIKLIKKQKNNGSKGFILNLNMGLEMAQGKYIARMDADDISLPNRFQLQVNLLEENPKIFIVGSSIELIDEYNKIIKIKHALKSDNEIKNEMYNNISLYHPVIMFRNTDIRYRDKMLGCEDYDLYFRLILENKMMANITEVLLKYRILPSSISRSKNLFIRWMFVEKARSFFKESKRKRKDSYIQFEPEDFSEILNLNYKNKLEDIKLAANTAIKFSKKDELIIVLEKWKKYYKNETSIVYTLASLLPKKLLKVFSKLIRI